MRDDDPFNYPARCHERLLEIRGQLTRIEYLLGALLLSFISWLFFFRK